MKKLIAVSFFFVIGLMASVKASGWDTWQSTGICLSTSSGLELLEIDISSGSAVIGQTWVIVVDTNPIGITTVGTTQIPGHTFSNALFSPTQYVIPPIVAYATATTNDSNVAGIRQIKLQDVDGGGREINNGLAVFIVNQAGNSPGGIGVTVTAVTRRKPSGRWNR